MLAFESLEDRRLLTTNSLELQFAGNSVSENDTGGLLATVIRHATDNESNLQVTLRPANPALIQAPNVVTIPQGLDRVQFLVMPFDNNILTGPQTVDVSAFAVGFTSDTQSVTILDHETLELSVSHDELRHGPLPQLAELTVQRSNVNVESELTVSLSSNGADRLDVPSSITIPAGQSQASITFETIDPASTSPPEIVAITGASDSYVSGSVDVTVIDTEYLGLSLSQDSISENAGPDAAVLTIQRYDSDLSGELVVSLTSADETEVETPATAVIPSGASSVTVSLNAVDDQELDGLQQASIIVTAPDHGDASISIDVEDYESLSIQIANSRIQESDGVGATTAMVSRSTTDVSQALRVAVFNSDGSEIETPATIEIPAGESMVTFSIDALNDNIFDAAQEVDVTVSAIGFEDATASLEVLDAALNSWTNPIHPYDVDANNFLNVRDILVLVYEIRVRGPRPLPPPSRDSAPPPFLDTSNDNIFNTVDILRVMNYLNTYGPGPVESAQDAEGETQNPGEGEEAGPITPQSNESSQARTVSPTAFTAEGESSLDSPRMGAQQASDSPDALGEILNREVDQDDLLDDIAPDVDSAWDD